MVPIAIPDMEEHNAHKTVNTSSPMTAFIAPNIFAFRTSEKKKNKLCLTHSPNSLSEETHLYDATISGSAEDDLRPCLVKGKCGLF
ncbi:hypothetical protein VNO77_03091 [Canavalia gladiata]|uniref:Uncharacterized protein n=1 Tax=Canavalia gladiata TaxID=3824 RepID=A0AAN9MUS8_CANGL